MGNEEGRYSAGSLILGFFIGGLVGAGVALLLAPQPGPEARQNSGHDRHSQRQLRPDRHDMVSSPRPRSSSGVPRIPCPTPPCGLDCIVPSDVAPARFELHRAPQG